VNGQIIILGNQREKFLREFTDGGQDPAHALMAKIDWFAIHHGTTTCNEADVIRFTVIDGIWRHAAPAEGSMDPRTGDSCVPAFPQDGGSGIRVGGNYGDIYRDWNLSYGWITVFTIDPVSPWIHHVDGFAGTFELLPYQSPRIASLARDTDYGEMILR